MSTPALVLQRNWQRVRVCIPALITVANGKRNFAAEIKDISENGIGFAATENLLGTDGIVASFWLPFDPRRPNQAMFEPVTARLALASSRYAVEADTYAYGAVFVELGSALRREVQSFMRRRGSEK